MTDDYEADGWSLEVYVSKAQVDKSDTDNEPGKMAIYQRNNPGKMGELYAVSDAETLGTVGINWYTFSWTVIR